MTLAVGGTLNTNTTTMLYGSKSIEKCNEAPYVFAFAVIDTCIA